MTGQWIGVDDLKPAGTSEPEISETSISPSDEFLVNFFLLIFFVVYATVLFKMQTISFVYFQKVHIQHPNLGCCPRVYVHRDHTKGRKQQLQKKLNKAMCVDRDRGI